MQVKNEKAETLSISQKSYPVRHVLASGIASSVDRLYFLLKAVFQKIVAFFTKNRNVTFDCSYNNCYFIPKKYYIRIIFSTYIWIDRRNVC
ncbi:hypothetical protein DFP93_103299 [Aneurinibacillus soli]|uniref:Uncharacterized protein n=1 Tax=Aneurinibacillus soli TaxID=1500254 RepID=A0A0U4WK10_9BACL|nr:hypothetical protein DFP93_103299 [Aneurinibacillus soli]BAU28856.1 hypothetical protein CB4_03033 [Aneurinibacillus soli]